MDIDILFVTHLLLQFIVLSIPFWSLTYLKYGVYIPLIISFLWLIFNGCPMTKMQSIGSNSFTYENMKLIFPDITKEYVDHILVFIFIFITVVGFRRLCKK